MPSTCSCLLSGFAAIVLCTGHWARERWSYLCWILVHVAHTIVSLTCCSMLTADDIGQPGLRQPAAGQHRRHEVAARDLHQLHCLMPSDSAACSKRSAWHSDWMDADSGSDIVLNKDSLLTSAAAWAAAWATRPRSSTRRPRTTSTTTTSRSPTSSAPCADRLLRSCSEATMTSQRRQSSDPVADCA
jgi:hypothetical protein